MTDEEFWRSTLAKVVALYDVKRLTWDRTRDELLAQIATFQANRYLRTEKSDKLWGPGDFLGLVYPRDEPKDVIITPKLDAPERGASGSQDFKSSMKGMTKSRASRVRKKLRPFTPRPKKKS